MRTRRFATSLGIWIALATAGSAAAQVDPTGKWDSMPEAEYEMYGNAGCTDGTRYAYYTLSDYGILLRYDSVTNAWEERSGPPDGFWDSASTFSNGLMYVFPPEWFTSSPYTYDPAGDEWAQLSDTYTSYALPSACTGPDGMVWFNGGETQNFYRLTPATGAITPRANLPIAVYAATLTCVPSTGRIYLVGGINSFTGDHSAATYEYDPVQDSWTQMADRPREVFAHGSFSLKGRVYTCAGANNNVGYLRECYEFAPSSNTWTRRADLLNDHSWNVGAGVTGTEFGWIFGGEYPYNTIERFTPPVFGSDPDPASNVVQIGSLGVTPQAGADPNVGWTNSQIRLQAEVRDPDVGQFVRLEVQVKPANGTWTGAPIVSSGLQSQGTVFVDYPIPAGGDYDWRYRVADDYDNYTPNVGGVPGWTEFENNAVSPDFRSDQVAPPPPTFVYPLANDLTGPSLVQNDVTLVWNPTTDNGPTAALRYSVDVSFNDPAFGNIVASASGLTATQQAFTLPTSRYNYYWRVGATDIGGNFSGWATGAYFRVLGDDGINHSSGDAGKVLGCSAGASAGRLAGALAGLLALGAGLRRRFRA